MHLSRKTRHRILKAGVVLLILLLAFLFRTSILRGIGNFLIDEDPLRNGDVVLVLGGNSVDRGVEAAELLKDGYAEQALCIGGNIPSVFEPLKMEYTEGELSAMVMRDHGVDSSRITTIPKGTSTKEEVAVSLKRVRKEEWDTVIVVSDKFHLQRVEMVFEEPYTEAGVELILHGAPSSLYDEEEWWKSEEGMIMVNNEYMKLMYYLVKH